MLNESLKHPLWNEYLAPGIATLQKVSVRRIPSEIRPDISQFVITSILVEIAPKTRIRTLNFIRRTTSAIDCLDRAQTCLDSFFQDSNPNDYFRALESFEACLAAAFQGHELLFGISGQPFFNPKGTGRALLNSRMGRLYNTSKHAEGIIKSSAFSGKTLPLWITNGGLSTGRDRLSFDEINEIITDMSVSAFICAKSYVWTNKPIPEEIISLVSKHVKHASDQGQVADPANSPEP